MQKTTFFSQDDARRFYDRFGEKQDQQGFYEDAALDVLIEHGEFGHAQSVFEFGCGTGQLAARLLAEHLPTSAHYAATDISLTMANLAIGRLEPWAERAAVHMNSGEPEFSRYGGPFDRFVSTYVFDLLSVQEIAQSLSAAHDCMRNGGLLCVAGLTHGSGLLSSTTSKVWSLIHRIRPSLVGGCRPLLLADHMPQTQWRVLYRAVVDSWSIPSEVLVAEAI